MQFIVPQFIDIEPKIIGPITPRQFIILIVGAGLCFVAYKSFSFVLFIFVSLLILGACFALAFFKVNGQPVHFFLLNFIQTLKKPGLRIWKVELVRQKEEAVLEKKEEKPVDIRPTLSSGQLSKISLLVDTGGVYREEE